MITVLIVEDHPIVREGVTAVLERERDIDVAGAADSLAEGLRLAAKLRPDVVLLDLKLPDAGAVDGVAAFARDGRSVLVFTAHEADDDVFRAIRGGARGYLLKGSPAAEIARAIRQVHAGSRTSARASRRSS
jgi:DNA-binding NarL/FixJ family response regulator